MRRKIFFTILLLLISIISYADSTVVYDVGPGMRHYSIRKDSGPFRIHIFEIDLNNSTNKIPAIVAIDTLGVSRELTSAMARRYNKRGNIVIGGINGDFFDYSTSQPINSTISYGVYAKGVSSSRSLVAVQNDNSPVVDIMSFGGSLKTKNETLAVNKVNQTRETNFLVVYNKFMGSSTKTNIYGTEIKLKRLETNKINSFIKYLVAAKVQNIGNMSIVGDDVILSGHGTARDFLNVNVQVGDTVELNLGTSPDRGDLFSLMGGGPRLVTNGTRPASFVGVEGITDANFIGRNPRTAVGIDADSSKLYFLVVDGRQPGFSVGMSLYELADFMISFGMYQAVNLDGGGSSVIVVRNQIVNSPSDAAGERPVANALLAVTTAGINDLINNFSLTPRRILIDSTQTQKISIKAKDKWGYDLEVSAHDLTWEFQNISGSINSLGNYIPVYSGNGYIIGRIGSLTDTIEVAVVSPSQGSIIIDEFSNLASITGLTGQRINFDSCGYRLNNEIFFSTPSALELEYNFTFNYGYSNIISLITDLPIPSKPDTILLKVLNDKNSHQLILKVSDRDNQDFYIDPIILNKYDTTWQKLRFRTSVAIPIVSGTKLDFPIRLKELIVYLKNEISLSGQTYKGKLFFDDLGASFGSTTSIDIDKDKFQVFNFTLEQNYPNPFNSGTVMKFRIPHSAFITLKVYDILGREIATLVDEFKTAGKHTVLLDTRTSPHATYPSGVYIYRLTAGNFSASRKMLLAR